MDALHDSNDYSCCPAEHDNSVGRFERGQHSPAFIENDIAVTQCGKCDHGKINRLFRTFDGIQHQIGATPYQHLDQRGQEHNEDGSAHYVKVSIPEGVPFAQSRLPFDKLQYHHHAHGVDCNGCHQYERADR